MSRGQKISRYIVTYPVGENLYLWSTRTGSIIKMDNDEWQNIRAHPSLHVGSDHQLYRDKFVVDEDEDELLTVLSANKDEAEEDQVIDLVIVPSTNCPLGCNLGAFGSYCGQVHTKNKMATDVASNIETFVKNSLRPYHKVLRVNWFGGEPLLAFDRMGLITKSLRELCLRESLTYQASIVTGGTLLTPQVARKCLEELAVSAVSLTLDGLAQDHDQRRCTKGGNPTFGIILDNIIGIASDAILNAMTISVRCNVDSRNIQAPSDLIQLFHELGLHKRIDFYAVPVHPWGDRNNEEILADRETFSRQEIIWFEQMKTLGYGVSLMPQRKSVVCRVVSKSKIVIDFDGSISRCTESPLTAVNKNRDLVGNIGSPEPLDGIPTWTWHNDVESAKYPCASCEYYPVCGGACPLSWRTGSDIPCPSFKLNGQDRLGLFAKWDQEKRDSLTQMRSSFAIVNIALELARTETERKLIRQIDQDLIGFRQHPPSRSTFDDWELSANFSDMPWDIRILLKASIKSTAAYLAYKNDDSAALFHMTEAALLELQKLDDRAYIDTRPARIEIIINYSHACIRRNWTIHPTLREALDAYFSFGVSIGFGRARVRKLSPAENEGIFAILREAFQQQLVWKVDQCA